MHLPQFPTSNGSQGHGYPSQYQSSVSSWSVSSTDPRMSHLTGGGHQPLGAPTYAPFIPSIPLPYVENSGNSSRASSHSTYPGSASSSSSTFSLIPVLLNPSNYLFFNVAQPVEYIQLDPHYDIYSAIAKPYIHSISIMFSGCPHTWRLDIIKNRPLTLRDVMYQMQSYLNQPISNMEFPQLPIDVQERMRKNFDRRYSRHAPAHAGGICKIDNLGSKTIFVGMELTNVHGQPVWIAHFTRSA